MALFDFEEMGNASMGSSDFITICRNFKTIIIKNIPVISTNNKNVARRFIILVTYMYLVNNS